MPLYSPASSGGGTIILDGTGVPDPAFGNAGNYYVDIAGGDLYGPKVATGTADYVTIPYDTTAVGTYELGGKFKFDVNGYVTGVRYYYPNVTPALGQVLSLWTAATSTLIVSKSATFPTQNTWNVLNFDAPAPVTAGTVYMVSLWTDGPGFSYNAAIYAGPIVSGHVRAMAHNEDAANAAFYTTTQGAYPTTPWTSFPTVSPMFTLGAGWSKVITGV